MRDDTNMQPAAPGPEQVAPQMTPQAPPEPQPQQAAPAPAQEQKGSLWKNMLMGAMIGMGNSGGATSFGGGVAAGAGGVMKHAQQQRENELVQQREARLNANMESEMKFRDVQTAAAAAALARIDQDQQQKTQDFQMKLDEHAQNQVKFLMDNIGMQFDAIPNNGDNAMAYLQQAGKTSEDGMVGIPGGVIVSPSMIYVPKQGTENTETQYEYLRKMSPLFGLPVPPRETFARLTPDKRNAALSPVANLIAGHGRNGEPLTLNELPSAVAYLRTSLARYAKDPQRDEKVMAQGQQTLDLLQAQLDEGQKLAKERAHAGRPGVYIPLMNEKGEITGYYNNRNPQEQVAPPVPGQRRSALPAQENADRASFATLVGQFDRLKALAAKRPDAIGPVQGRVKSIEQEFLGGDEEAADIYQTANDIQNQLIYLFSGKQINEAEYKRLSATFPKTTLPMSTFKTRLKNFEGRMNEVYLRRTGRPISGEAAPGAPQTQERKPLSAFEGK